MKLKRWKNEEKMKMLPASLFWISSILLTMYKTFFSSPMTPRRNKLERFVDSKTFLPSLIFVTETPGLYHKTLQIHNLWKMDRFQSKQVSFLWPITNPLAWTNTLAFFKIRKLQIYNALLYRPQEPTHKVRHRKVLHPDKLRPHSHSSRQNALAYLLGTSLKNEKKFCKVVTWSAILACGIPWSWCSPLEWVKGQQKH